MFAAGVVCLGAVAGCTSASSGEVAGAAPSETPAPSVGEAAPTSTSHAAIIDKAKIPWGAAKGGGGVSTVTSTGVMTFYPATADTAIDYTIELDETYTEIARRGCPEQLEGHPVAAVLVAHCSRASGGLAEIVQVLVWKMVSADRNETSGEVVLDWGVDADAKLVGVSLIGSVITASFVTSGPKRYRRIGISPSDRSRVAWVNDSDDDSNLIDPELVLANSHGLAVISIPGGIVGVDAGSGKQLWRTKVPKGSGTVAGESRTHAIVEPYTSGGYGVGLALLSKDDGTILTRYQSNAIVFDGATEQALVSYPVKETSSNNDAQMDPAAPALEVLDLKTGRPVFTLTKAAAKGLRSNVLATGAFDGRAVVTVADGVRAILTENGQPDPRAPTFPPSLFRLHNVPVASRGGWVLLGSTNGYGRFETYGGKPQYDAIVRGDALSASDIPTLESYR